MSSRNEQPLLPSLTQNTISREVVELRVSGSATFYYSLIWASEHLLISLL